MDEKEFRKRYETSLIENKSIDFLLKKVTQNFKKKRKRWLITLGYSKEIDVSYFQAKEYMKYFSKSFSDEEKEKYEFNKLKVGVTPVDDIYVVQVYYG